MSKKQARKDFNKSLFEIAMAVSLTVVLMFAAQGIAVAFSGGPPAGRTGAPGESTCSDCHFSDGEKDGSLELTGVPEPGYEPGTTYTITVNLKDPEQSRWGFQLTVLDNVDNNPAGTLIRTDTTNTQLLENGRQYIEHTSAGTFAGNLNEPPLDWSFDWQAPDPGVGPVTFYIAGNAADNNGQAFTPSDFIYTITDESLAVELASLTAISPSDIVTIKWSTATETNNLGFNIYRSETKDGKYIRLNASLIAGAGTDATPHNYSFADDDVALGKTYYYYIEDIDFTGQTNKSDIIQVTVGQQQKNVISDRFVRKTKPVIPKTFALLQNYPNPFNPETWFPYQLAGNANVIIRIYNANGKIVRTLRMGNQTAGAYVNKELAAHWDGKNERGDKVASGLYFYTLQADKFTATRRMLIVK